MVYRYDRPWLTRAKRPSADVLSRLSPMPCSAGDWLVTAVNGTVGILITRRRHNGPRRSPRCTLGPADRPAWALRSGRWLVETEDCVQPPRSVALTRGTGLRGLGGCIGCHPWLPRRLGLGIGVANSSARRMPANAAPPPRSAHTSPSRRQNVDSTMIGIPSARAFSTCCVSVCSVPITNRSVSAPTRVE